MHPLRARLRQLALRGLSPTQAVLVGAAGLAILAAVVLAGVLDDHRPAQGLLFVVVVAGTAVLGGRTAAYVITVLATVSFALLLPPRGRPQIHVADDVVALIVFSIVALAVGNLVAYRIEVLGRVERQRAALLRSVSHDLRTPLGTMNAAVSVLQDQTWLEESQRRDLLDTIAEEGQRLDRLVANLLSLARVEAGALEPKRQAVDLDELVQHAVARLRRDGAPAIVTEVAPDLPFVEADYTLLEQVLSNLLENAQRHSPPDELVVVRVSTVADAVRIVVADRGPGVPAGQETAIFEPFRTGPTAGASGIGLAIAKAVVEAHGGTIRAGGAPEGGAEFTVTLPLA